MHERYRQLVVWCSVSALASINKVNLRRKRLVQRWATLIGFNFRFRTFISVCNQPATQGQLSLPSLRCRQITGTRHDVMTLPVHGKGKGAGNHQLQKVAERWRLHRPVRSTFPAYDVTCQLTYFRRVAELPVFRGDDSWRAWFRHGHTPSRAFHYLYVHKIMSWLLTQNTARV